MSTRSLAISIFLALRSEVSGQAYQSNKVLGSTSNPLPAAEVSGLWLLSGQRLTLTCRDDVSTATWSLAKEYSSPLQFADLTVIPGISKARRSLAQFCGSACNELTVTVPSFGPEYAGLYACSGDSAWQADVVWLNESVLVRTSQPWGSGGPATVKYSVQVRPLNYPVDGTVLWSFVNISGTERVLYFNCCSSAFLLDTRLDSSGTATFKIDRFQRFHDAGVYFCNISLSKWQPRRLSGRTIISEPLKAEISYSFAFTRPEPGQVVRQYLGTRLKLFCVVDGYDPDMYVAISREGMVLRSSLRLMPDCCILCTVTISKLARTDAGNYSCAARQTARGYLELSSSSLSLQVVAYVPPERVNVSTDFVTSDTGSGKICDMFVFASAGMASFVRLVHLGKRGTH